MLKNKELTAFSLPHDLPDPLETEVEARIEHATKTMFR
jgi:hypothetical protein